MCDKCTKRSILIEIHKAEAALDKAFKQVDGAPFDIKKDYTFLSLTNKMADLLEKYNKVK